MRIFLFIIFCIIALFGITFAYLNAGPVAFNYYLGQKTLPLSLLLGFTLGIGILLGFFFAVIPLVKLQRKNRKLKKDFKCAQKELENLRTMPARD